MVKKKKKTKQKSLRINLTKGGHNLIQESKPYYESHGSDGQLATKRVISFLRQSCCCPARVSNSHSPALHPERHMKLVLGKRI